GTERLFAFQPEQFREDPTDHGKREAAPLAKHSDQSQSDDMSTVVGESVGRHVAGVGEEALPQVEMDRGRGYVTLGDQVGDRERLHRVPPTAYLPQRRRRGSKRSPYIVTPIADRSTEGMSGEVAGRIALLTDASACIPSSHLSRIDLRV